MAKDWGVKDKVVCCVNDNAANITKAVKFLKSTQLPYLERCDKGDNDLIIKRNGVCCRSRALFWRDLKAKNINPVQGPAESESWAQDQKNHCH